MDNEEYDDWDEGEPDPGGLELDSWIDKNRADFPAERSASIPFRSARI